MKQIAIRKDEDGNKFFVVTFPYDKEMMEAVKKIPQRKWDPDDKVWFIPVDISVVRYVDVFSRYYEFEMSLEAIESLEELKTPPTAKDVDIPTLRMQLREFQKLGVAYAEKSERCFIADDMGLGKTAESIATVEKLQAYPCLVICPASVKLNWQKEVSMWLDKISVVVSGEKSENSSYHADFVIINYDILEKHEKNLKAVGFKSVILDESHYVKGHKSKRTKSARSIARNIKYRFALTGTPVLNKPRELIPQLDILGRLDSFGGFWNFSKRYCDAKESDFGWDFSGNSNLDELHQKLREMCFIRRMKTDVLDELPDKQRSIIPIEIDNLAEYREVKKDFSEWIAKKIFGETTGKFIRNIKIDAEAKLRINQTLAAEALVKIEYLKQVCARGKVSRIMDFIDNTIEQGNKLVVFSVHKEIQQQLYNHYKKQGAARIFGDDTIDVRQENIDRFQNSKKCKLMIASLAAGGIGVTLTAGSTVAFVEFGWTPAIHEQAEDRCYRIGQKNSVNCYYFSGKDTIDEDILALIEEKRKVVQNVTDGKSIQTVDSDVEKILQKFI